MSVGNKKLLLDIFSMIGNKNCYQYFTIAIFTAILDLAGIALIYPYISIVLNPSHLEKFSFFENVSHQDATIFISVVLVLFYILKAYIHRLLFHEQNRISAQFTRKITDSIIKKILNAKFEIFNTISTARLAGVAFSNTIHASLVLQSIAQGVCEIVFLAFLFLGFVLVAPLITSILILIFAAYLLVVYRPLGQEISNLGKRQNAVENSRHRILHSIVGSIRDIKIMGLSDIFNGESKEISNNFADVTTAYSTKQGVTRIYLEAVILIAFVSLIQVFLVKGYTLSQIGPIAGVAIVASLRALPSFSKLLMSINSYRYSKPFVDKLIEVENLLNQDQQCKVADNLNYQISFSVKNLTFYYGQNLILNNVDLHIPKGSAIGIVGPSGSGKSTLLDILTGLLQSREGVFEFDNVPFNPFTSLSLQTLLGYVPQSISLLVDSIAYNITFELTPDMQRLYKVLQMANLKEFIESLENGVDTMVGEGGIGLSGGQRQRIGIARALYKEPQILVFDEATSALDAFTEQSMINEIANLKGYTSTVFVTHKLTSVVNCDCIYVLHKGMIVGSGTHMELMNSNRLYSEMYKLQEELS